MIKRIAAAAAISSRRNADNALTRLWRAGVKRFLRVIDCDEIAHVIIYRGRGDLTLFSRYNLGDVAI